MTEKIFRKVIQKIFTIINREFLNQWLEIHKTLLKINYGFVVYPFSRTTFIRGIIIFQQSSN